VQPFLRGHSFQPFNRQTSSGVILSINGIHLILPKLMQGLILHLIKKHSLFPKA
jgi:hypothetical protein